MPYTRITPSRNGREALNYALNGKGHDGSEKRNLLVGTVGLLPEKSMPFDEQMALLWGKASSKNKTQVRRLIASFSQKELDPKDPKSAEIALQIMTETLTEAYPGFPAVIAVQNDGRGGKLHVHAVTCNVNAETYKGFNDEQTKSWYLEKHFDAVAERYIELDRGELAREKVTQNERRQRAQNEEIKKENAENPEDKKALLYIWKDDLKERVQAAMGEAKDRNDFLKRLTAHGVEGTYRTSKKQGNFILYELTDTSGFDGKIPQNLKAKSYKLGADFGCEALEAALTKSRHAANHAPAKVAPQKSADEQAKAAAARKEMAELMAWSAARGVNLYDPAKGLDYELYESEKKKYKAYLQEPAQPKRAAKAPEKVQPAPSTQQTEAKKSEHVQAERQKVEARREEMQGALRRDARRVELPDELKRQMQAQDRQFGE